MAKRPAAALKAPAAPVLDHIHESLRGFAVELDSLTLDPANARLHDERNLKAIADSLVAHGFLVPIVVQQQGLIVRAGNGRCIVAKQRGWTHVPAVVVDQSEVEAIAFALRDNRSAELARWDFQVLSAHMKALTADGFDLSTAGWNEQEFAPLMEAAWAPPPAAPLENKPSAGAGDKLGMVEYVATTDQAIIINGAIAKVQQDEADPAIKPGRALELICASFVAGQ